MSCKLAESKRYLALLFADAGKVELRRIVGSYGDNRTRWFDDPAALWEQARKWAGDGIALYTSLNPPNNDQKFNRGLKDASVECYKRLLFDFDPVREKGTNACNDQLSAAVAMRDDFVQRMHAMGWPEPVMAISGNGAHAQYRVEIDTDRKGDIADFYRGLSQRLRGAGVDFDVTTHNPSRVCRLYGTLNRKGPNDQYRRQSSCAVPPDYRVVPEKCLQLAIETYRVERPKLVPRQNVATSREFRGKGDYRTLDVVGLFQSNGLYRFPMSAGKHSVLCPWAGIEHDVSCNTDTVVWETSATGYPQFHCHHAHCAGRWMPDVIAKLGNADQFCGSVYA